MTPETADVNKLVARFKKGDERAFNDLVNLFKKPLYYAVYKMVRNSDDAMDIAQDAFVRAYKSIDTYKGEAGFYTWLYRIAMNLSINHIKRNKTKDWETIDELPLKAPKSNPGKDTEQSELQELISKAVAGLPEKQRAIFVMRHYEDMSHEEIAKTMGNSEGAVKAGYFHAVKKMQEALAIYKGWME